MAPSASTQGGDRLPETGTSAAPRRAATPRGPARLVWRTLVSAWDDGIFGMSAQAAFWMALSLPPLLLALLGSLGFVSRWFGEATVSAVQREILSVAGTVFTEDVVNQIIAPTVSDILTQGRTSIMSVGFVLSLWAGSSALASLVDSITAAYGQHTVRNPIWQRTFALLLYIVALVGSVVVLPVVALGPGLIPDLFPEASQPLVSRLVGIFYYPVLGVLLILVLATLYKVVLPRKLPWHRGLPGAVLAMVVFLVSSVLLRRYITWVTSTGYTYGALATPIAFLLFSFFIAMAIVFGAEFNHTVETMWPAHPTRRERRRWRRLEMERYAARAAARRDEPRTSGGDRFGDGPGASSPADTRQTVQLPRNGAPTQTPAGHDTGRDTGQSTQPLSAPER